MAKVLSGAGLRGQVAGKTALSTVGVSGSGLTYRGYDVKDLANNCQFEEVAYLILKGKLPNQTELDEYKAKLKGMRSLPQALLDVLERMLTFLGYTLHATSDVATASSYCEIHRI